MPGIVGNMRFQCADCRFCSVTSATPTSDVPVPNEFASLQLDPAVLPDVVLYDLDQGDVWFIEVAATDGVVTETRQQQLVTWAEQNDMSAEQCRFVTAFASRTAAVVRKRIAVLAWDSMVWVADEPNSVIYLSELT